MKKYEMLPDQTEQIYGATLCRIRALVDFTLEDGTPVHAGDLGGWIEQESNLSHEDAAWVSGSAKVSGGARVFDSAEVSGGARVSGGAEVFDSARVFGDAEVSGNAWVRGDAKVYGNAEVSGIARVYGNAEVSGGAWVYGGAKVFDSAKVYGIAEVFGDARVSGGAEVSGIARVFGDARVSGGAEIYNDRCYIVHGPTGSREDFITFFNDKELGIAVSCGCFLGGIDAFLQKVKETHGTSIHAQIYEQLAAVSRLQIASKDSFSPEPKEGN